VHFGTNYLPQQTDFQSKAIELRYLVVPTYKTGHTVKSGNIWYGYWYFNSVYIITYNLHKTRRRLLIYKL